MSDYMQHPDEHVHRAIIRLSDALCTWERATGRRSILIIREQHGFEYRAMDGKPGIPSDVRDVDLIACVTEAERGKEGE